MAEDWCEKCDMALAFCEHGNPPTSDLPQETQYRTRPRDCTEGDQDGPTIQAQSHGDCPRCGDTIFPGDWIRHLDDGWVHSLPRETSSGRPPDTDASMFDGMD